MYYVNYFFNEFRKHHQLWFWLIIFLLTITLMIIFTIITLLFIYIINRILKKPQKKVVISSDNGSESKFTEEDLMSIYMKEYKDMSYDELQKAKQEIVESGKSLGFIYDIDKKKLDLINVESAKKEKSVHENLIKIATLSEFKKTVKNYDLKKLEELDNLLSTYLGDPKVFNPYEISDKKLVVEKLIAVKK